MDRTSPDTVKGQSEGHDSVSVPADYHAQIVASLSSGVVAVDHEGVILTANAAAARQVGLGPGELRPGLRFDEMPGLERFAEVFREMMSTGQAVSRREMVVEGPAGRRVIGLTASLLQGQGSSCGAAFLFTDLTRVRELEHAAEINRQLAQIGELTAGVVHELRNPLSVISGMAELLARKLGEEPALERRAGAILHEAGQLDKLISQFLTFARPFEVQRARCSPEEIVQRALELCERLAQQRGVRVESCCTVESFEVDSSKIAQALSSLLRNAIEVQTVGGWARVSCMQHVEDVILRVDDLGPGMHLSEGEDPFTPFFSKKEGGTGLGLPMVHRIVTAHGGTVHYGNRAEGGAYFEIRLPIVSDKES